MPTIINAYRAQGTGDSLGDLLGNLGDTLFGPKALQAGLYREKTKSLSRDNESTADVQKRAREGNLDLRDPGTQAAIYGLENPEHFLQARRGIVTATQGAMSPAAADAYVGAGGAYGSTGPGFQLGQDTEIKKADMATARALAAEKYKADTTPVNVVDSTAPGGMRIMSKADAVHTGAQPVVGNSEAEGFLKLRGFDSGYAGQNPQQLHAAGALPAQDHFYNYVVPGPNGPQLGRSVDGRTDITTGQPLPPNAQLVSPANAGGGNVMLAPTQPDATQARDIRGKLVSNRELSALVDRADQLVARDPSIVGAPGTAQRLGQNAVSAARDIANYFGHGQDWQQSLHNIQGEAVARLGPSAAKVIPEIFKPQISELEALHAIILYKAAEAMFGQSGRDLSDRDVHGARGVVGDPNSLFESSQAFRTKMQFVKKQADQNADLYQRMLTQGNVAVPQVGGAPAAAPAVPGAAQPQRIRIDAQGNVIP